MYVKSTPRQPRPSVEHLNFRLITPEVVAREYQTLISEGSASVDDFRRCANRLNTWIAQHPPDDADIEPLEML